MERKPLFKMNALMKTRIESIKKEYEGRRVKLLYSEADGAPPKGTLGTVLSVDDMGTRHVLWDNGTQTEMILGLDACSVIKE